MANRLKLISAVVLVVIAIPAGRWVRHTRPWESAIQRVPRLYRECGLASQAPFDDATLVIPGETCYACIVQTYNAEGLACRV